MDGTDEARARGSLSRRRPRMRDASRTARGTESRACQQSPPRPDVRRSRKDHGPARAAGRASPLRRRVRRGVELRHRLREEDGLADPLRRRQGAGDPVGAVGRARGRRTREIIRRAHLRRPMTEPSVLASGRFTIQRRIGAGGMGVVYEAFDRDRGHVVALKKLLGTDATAIYRLKSEFRALADVVHPNLVRLYELVGEGDEWFFTMELVDGVDFLQAVRGRNAVAAGDVDSTERSTIISDTGASLAEAMQKYEATPPPAEEQRAEQVVVDYAALRRIVRQLGEGVCALHDQEKLHRDLKPSNVLVTPSGRVVILDFGLATDASGFDRRATFGGTPAYMAPEQIADQPASEASDCYAIGVMLYEALTGTLPFTGNFYAM